MKRSLMGENAIKADWNQAKVGDIVYAINSKSLGLVSPLNYKRNAVGFVFGIENNKVYVIAPTTFVSVFGIDMAVDLPIGYNSDGKSNCEKLSSQFQNQIDSWPLIKHYQNYAPYGTQKGNWFLPAYNQYAYLYRNRSTIGESASIAGIYTDLTTNSNSEAPFPAWWVSSSYGGYASDRRQYFFYGYGFDNSGSWRMIADEKQRYALMMQIDF